MGLNMTYFTRAGSIARLINEAPDSLLGFYRGPGDNWIPATWNIDGSYGLKSAPEYLKGLSSDKLEVIAMIFDKSATSSLDLALQNMDDPLAA